MGNLIDPWLRLPSLPVADLDRYRVTFHAAQKCGGIRAGNGCNWIAAVFADPPSIYRDVPGPILEDFVVFDPASPARFRCMYRAATMLGEEAFREARLDRLPLPVYRTPLAWLQQAGAGVVPLDPPAFGRAMIGESVRLVAEDRTHAKQIKRAITTAAKIGLPEIRIAA